MGCWPMTEGIDPRATLKAELRRLWAEGLLTREIGAALGISKSAVVGLAHRLGLERRPSPIGRNNNPRASAQGHLHGPTGGAETRPARPPEKTQSVDVPPQPGAGLTTAHHGCRWVEGEPRGLKTNYCNAPRIIGTAWCPKHRRIVYRGKIPAMSI